MNPMRAPNVGPGGNDFGNKEKQYDDKFKCAECSGINKIKIKDSIRHCGADHISECETECSKCHHKDYWAYGWFESKSIINEN